MKRFVCLAQPRPTLETYKYQMPGEAESPVQHHYLFDMTDNSRKEIRTAAFKNRELNIERKPRLQRGRDKEDCADVWQGDDYSTRKLYF